MIERISYREIIEATDLLAEYAAECSLPELGEISPQAHIYKALEESGGMQAFGVYKEKLLIGFATVLIYVVPHYGKKIAATESIFVSGKHRIGSHGLALVDAVADYVRERECRAILYSAPMGSRFARILRARRYRHTNEVFLRSL